MGNMQFHANEKLPTDVIHDILKRNHAVQMIQLVSSELYARAMKTPRVVKNIKVSEWLKIFDKINTQRKSSIVKVDFSDEKYDDDFETENRPLKFQNITVFQSFMALPNLREINLSNNENFCFPQFQSLCNFLPLLTALTSLDLSSCTLLQHCEKEKKNWNRDFFANIFKQCLKLKTLELNCIMLLDADDDSEEIHYEFEVFLQIITALPACKSIRTLGLVQQFMKPDFQNRMIECVVVILNQVDWSSKLEKLTLAVSHKDCTEYVSMVPIIQALHNCVSLKTIFLSVKGLEAAYSFIDIVKHCTKILNFDGYAWSPNLCLHLLNLIQQGYCKNFTSLHWKDTNLKSNGAKKLAIAMQNKQLPNLRRLMLSYNGFEALDIVDLMAASRSCEFLTEVFIKEKTDLLGNSTLDRLKGLNSKITTIKFIVENDDSHSSSASEDELNIENNDLHSSSDSESD